MIPNNTLSFKLILKIRTPWQLEHLQLVERYPLYRKEDIGTIVTYYFSYIALNHTHCDLAWENRAYVHIKFDYFFRI